ncbi:MAG: hypothetical protein PHQ47_03990 [Candidatus Portnoybacteria bacterium]|nr:hypothetical protein [Candidatus Portnoybacteria bacterium]
MADPKQNEGKKKEALEVEIADIFQKSENEFSVTISLTAKVGDQLAEGVYFEYLIINGTRMELPEPTDENGKSLPEVTFITEAKTMHAELLANFGYKKVKATRSRIPLPRKKKDEVAEIKEITRTKTADEISVVVARLDQFEKAIGGKILIADPQENGFRPQDMPSGTETLNFQAAPQRRIVLFAAEKPNVTCELEIPDTTDEPKSPTPPLEKPGLAQISKMAFYAGKASKLKPKS